MRTFAVIGLTALLAACNFRTAERDCVCEDEAQAAAPTSAVTDGERTGTEAREVRFRDSDRQVTASPATTSTTGSDAPDATPSTDAPAGTVEVVP
jgi:hypothetical protein